MRILTAVLKFRACRDNIGVATGAMEVRGGNGYIEDWVNSRLIRDAHIGVLWEGTSNINALDVINRAVAKSGGHETLARALKAKLNAATAAPAGFRAEVAELVDRAAAFAGEVASKPRHERLARLATDALYNAASAALMTWEGAATGAAGGDARRLVLARMVVEHRLRAEDPLAIPASGWEEDATTALLDPGPVSLERAVQLATD
jgi:hypothetical protein